MEEVRVQKRNMIILIVAIVVVVLVGLTLFYCIMAKHQQGRFPAKTTINGIDVSGMTAERAKDELADSVESYTLTIQERGDVTETITAEDIARLGEGGLCLGCAECHWPNCGFGHC